MNAMVVQFNKDVFGEDAHEFRPERWLESEEKYRAMERAMLVFGAGTRTCIGKHVSALTSEAHQNSSLTSCCSFRIWRCVRWCRRFCVGSQLGWLTIGRGRHVMLRLSCKVMLSASWRGAGRSEMIVLWYPHPQRLNASHTSCCWCMNKYIWIYCLCLRLSLEGSSQLFNQLYAFTMFRIRAADLRVA